MVKRNKTVRKKSRRKRRQTKRRGGGIFGNLFRKPKPDTTFTVDLRSYEQRRLEQQQALRERDKMLAKLDKIDRLVDTLEQEDYIRPVITPALFNVSAKDSYDLRLRYLLQNKQLRYWVNDIIQRDLYDESRINTYLITRQRATKVMEQEKKYHETTLEEEQQKLQEEEKNYQELLAEEREKGKTDLITGKIKEIEHQIYKTKHMVAYHQNQLKQLETRVIERQQPFKRQYDIINDIYCQYGWCFQDSLRPAYDDQCKQMILSPEVQSVLQTKKDLLKEIEKKKELSSAMSTEMPPHEELRLLLKDKDVRQLVEQIVFSTKQDLKFSEETGFVDLDPYANLKKNWCDLALCVSDDFVNEVKQYMKEFQPDTSIPESNVELVKIFQRLMNESIENQKKIVQNSDKFPYLNSYCLVCVTPKLADEIQQLVTDISNPLEIETNKILTKLHNELQNEAQAQLINVIDLEGDPRKTVQNFTTILKQDNDTNDQAESIAEFRHKISFAGKTTFINKPDVSLAAKLRRYIIMSNEADETGQKYNYLNTFLCELINCKDHVPETYYIPD